MRCPRSSPPITGPCAVLLLVCSSSAIAGPPCDERQSSPGRMPEPVLGESITDIDASKAGELEVDLTASVGHSGGTRVWQGSVEVESRVTNRLGLEIELGHSFASVPEPGLVLRLAASWSLVHLDGIGFHGQAELSARLAGQIEEGPNLGEPRLPYSAGFRFGLDRNWYTLRLGIGAATGEAPSAHAIPAWASATVLFNFGRSRWGSLGLDSAADWTRPNPFTLAPTFILNGHGLHIPGTVAVVGLYGIPGGNQDAWFGLLVRVIADFDLAGGD